MTFSTLSDLVARMTSVITLRGAKAYELLQNIKETCNLLVNLDTLVCNIQRLTFTQRLMQYTQLPDGQVTFIAFYGSKTYHPRVLCIRSANQVTKQPLLPNKLIHVTGDQAEYKLLLNRLDVNHEAYVMTIYHEAQAKTQLKTSIVDLIEFREAIDQPCTRLANTISDLEEALDHLDSTMEEFSNGSIEDLKGDFIYNLDSTLKTIEYCEPEVFLSLTS